MSSLDAVDGSEWSMYEKKVPCLNQSLVNMIARLINKPWTRCVAGIYRSCHKNAENAVAIGTSDYFHAKYRPKVQPPLPVNKSLGAFSNPFDFRFVLTPVIANADPVNHVDALEQLKNYFIDTLAPNFSELNFSHPPQLLSPNVILIVEKLDGQTLAFRLVTVAHI
ncbi:hypothetical protein Ciccas_011614 [Cichlidogyrus casuarinus]|uniref:Uncharacterized protein n=1 Tax=Cichlidogyrus casuarinus TaxID=1844966 RepID=A0ABD2PRE8_9PLAT